MSNKERISVDEIPKYKKKLGSDISKAERKSKHKHEYKDCLLVYNGSPYKGKYCVICGKIRDWDVCREKCQYGYLQLPDEMVFKRYSNLEQFEVSTLWGPDARVLV